MRLSAIRNSPYYSETLLRRTMVYCNGFIAKPVVEFDEEAGWIVVVDIDDRGNTTPHSQSPVGVRCRKHTGRVQAIIRPVSEMVNPASVIHPDWLIEESTPTE